MLKITLVKSAIANTPINRRTVKALGLKKTGRTVYREDSPSIRGMVRNVAHLLKVETVDTAPEQKKKAKPAKAVAAEPKAAPKSVPEPKAEPKAKTQAKPAQDKPKPKKAPAKKPAAAKAAPKKTGPKKPAKKFADLGKPAKKSSKKKES